MAVFSLSQLYDKFEWDADNSIFELDRSDEVSGMGSLQPLHAELASPLFSGQLTTQPFNHVNGEEASAIIEELSAPGNYFEMCNPLRESPKEISLSSDWSGSSPSIVNINSNNRTLGFSNMPNGRTISVGDMLSFFYGSPSRYGMHRVTTGGIVNGSGEVTLSFFPHIRPGLQVGTAARFFRAIMLAKIIPGTVRKSTSNGVMTSFSFRFIQILRII